MQTLIIKDINNLYFTSDPHLNHKNIIEFCNRPFGSVEEMNKVIISNWNNTIKHGDWVYILGDFCLGDRKMWCYFLNQLPGNKILIQGNHDRDKNIPIDKFADVYNGFVNVEVKDPEIKGGSQRITLCHYPMLSWYHSHMGAWQLFGHWHSHKVVSPNNENKEVSEYVKEEYFYMDKVRPTQYDCGMDGNNFTPISYHNVKKIIQSKMT
jgi:calcineurin-like phosphoesterase family protein